MTYVLDSNIVSFYLREHKQVSERLGAAISNGDEIIIAPFSYYEVRRGLLLLDSEKRMQKFERFCKMFDVGQLNNSALDVAAGIYEGLCRKGRVIEDADIFIAAFCLQHGFTLVTNNMKHFENIYGLHSLGSCG